MKRSPSLVTGSVSSSFLGSEFEDFLFASIGEDQNEMPLSVASAVARLDLDPWQEAARLAELPREAAIQRLASLIAELPNGPSAHHDPEENATRLIALLPHQSSPDPVSHETWIGRIARDKSWDVRYVIAMIFVLGAFFIMANGQTAEKVNNTQAHTSDTASPFIPQPNAGP